MMQPEKRNEVKKLFPGVAAVCMVALGLSFCCLAVGAELPPLRTEIGDIPWDASTLQNAEKVVYGTDDRIDVYQENNANRISWAASTCAIVSASDLTSISASTYSLNAYAYTIYGYAACSGEPFGDQPTAAFCSAFMVGEDLIATAGHCVTEEDLPYIRFLFGFDMKNATTPALSFNANQIYTGVEIVHHGGTSDLDHAIVRVDRPITAPNATALPIRRSGTVATGNNVGVIGHPTGLPKKIAFGANTFVRDNSATGYFTANLDTYGGNSGSPVFNASTGLVEGILVRGAEDFVLEDDCFRSNTVDDYYGTGEEVTKSTVFASYVPELAEEGETPAEGEGEGNIEGESLEGEDVVYEGESIEGEGEEVWLIVPNVIGISSEEAQIEIEELGLVLGTVSQRYDDTVAEGLIISQQPDAGTTVMPETLVAIVVSQGPQFASVPDLFGKDVIEAKTLLLEAGLQLGEVTTAYHPTVAKRLIISQQPSAGSGVARDYEVAVTTSKGPEPVIIEGEGEGEEEGEVEGEGEGEDTQPKGCIGSLFKANSLTGTLKRLIGDWMLLGLALLSLTAFAQIKR